MRRNSASLRRLASSLGGVLFAGSALACAAPMAAAPIAAASPEYATAPSAAAEPVRAADAAPAPATPGRPASPAKAAPESAPAPPATLAKSARQPLELDAAAKPLLIYEATLGIQVQRESFTSSIERAIDVAESFGGYLLSRSDAGVTLRVPSESFRATLRELDAIGSVSRRSVTAEDVSEQFHDLEVRLKNLESVRNRLEQFLARAANVSEALTVGKELENVTRQIDEIKGRLQFLKTRAAYSLITIALEPKAAAVAKAVAGPPPPPPPRPRKLPVKWLSGVGLDDLLEIEE